MSMSPNEMRKLAKFMGYVLGRRPDEFGLVLEADGFLKIKTLLQGLQGDPEWRFVRPAHLEMLLMAGGPPCIEIEGDRVRACERSRLPRVGPPGDLPKLLYTAVRRRAYPVVHGKGIGPVGGPHVMLTADTAMAERIGRRIDNAPVVLTVQVAAALASGVRFQRYGEKLFLADSIPVGAFSGPPLPKAAPAKRQVPAEPARPKTPGSYFPDLAALDGASGTDKEKSARRGEASWKKDRRQARREKERSRN